MQLKYSIIIQGIINNDIKLKNILSLNQYSDDIIFATWNNNLALNYLNVLKKNKIKVLQLDDPGSVEAYTEQSITKFLNVNRRIKGFRAALDKCNNEFVFITRTDCIFNFEKAFWLYFQSKRKFGVTNVSSVNPHRFLAPNQYFAICDWLYVGRKLDFLDNFIEIDESKLISKISYQTGNQFSSCKLQPEQIFTMMLANQKDLIYKLSNESMIFDKKIIEKHNEVLENFVNIDWEIINLKSFKFRFFTNDWITYKKTYFQDIESFPIKRITKLLLYLISKIKSRL